MKFDVHVPGWAFCGTFEADNERQVRADVRKLYDYSRLPNGTSVRPCTPLRDEGPRSAARYMM